VNRIATTHYRYKRPPRKRNAVALEVPAIVTRARPRKEMASITRDVSIDKSDAQTSPGAAEPEQEAEPVPASKSVIVTARKPGRFGAAPDVMPEEHKRRGDGADAVWRKLMRRVHDAQ